ncbi:MAG: hypothetical protein AAF602_07250 [Myxococcota bacterium]
MIIALWLACTTDPMPPSYGLFLADGEFDPLEPSDPPATFEGFFTERLGWSSDDIADAREAGKAFFADAYGIDVDAEVTAGRLQWLEYRVDPRANYRVVALPDRIVPPEGWLIHEVAMSAIVIDPAGMTLGGPYAEVWVPPGPVGAFGYYQFDAVDDDGNDPSIVIDYHTDGVMGTTVDGRNLLYCAMESDQLGTGLGHITSEITQTEQGTLVFDFTNVQRWD